jgi:hypothetical protein
VTILGVLFASSTRRPVHRKWSAGSQGFTQFASQHDAQLHLPRGPVLASPVWMFVAALLGALQSYKYYQFLPSL